MFCAVVCLDVSVTAGCVTDQPFSKGFDDLVMEGVGEDRFLFQYTVQETVFVDVNVLLTDTSWQFFAALIVTVDMLDQFAAQKGVYDLLSSANTEDRLSRFIYFLENLIFEFISLGTDIFRSRV